MPLDRLHLRPLQNGLHSIYHAIEHLSAALNDADEEDFRAYDSENGTTVRRAGGAEYFVEEHYIKPPGAYGIKFSISHLIHGVELLTKAYLERVEPGSTLEPGRGSRTISMRTAARRLVEMHPGLLAPDHLELVLQAGEFRNGIEHGGIDMLWSDVRRLALDFLSVAVFLAFKLHNIRLSEEYSFDPYSEGQDTVGGLVGRLLAERSEITEAMVTRLSIEWASARPDEHVVLCLQCGARGVSVSADQCVACGALGMTEAGILIDELDTATNRLLALRQLLGDKRAPPVG